MNRRAAIYLLPSLVVLLLAGLWYWREPDMPAPVPPHVPAVQSPAKGDSLLVRGDFDWDHVSKTDLEEFADYFGQKKSPSGFKINRTIRSGETLLADVYEARPGEFVISKMTPTLKQQGDGTTVIEVDVSSLAITISGESRPLIANKKTLVPGNVYGISNLTAADGNYMITMSAALTKSGSNIKFKVDGQYQKPLRRPQPTEVD